jgi:putative sigma-54 modulation protein
MQIEVKGRNVPVTDELREQVQRRFEKVSRQVNPLAVLEVEFREERNPANPISNIAEATLFLKGTTLRAKECSRDRQHALKLVSEDLSRQVKRLMDKRRGPRAGAGVDVPVTTAAEPEQQAADAY